LNKKFILTLLNIPRVSRKTVNSILNNNYEVTLDETAILDMFIENRKQNKRIPNVSIEDIRNAKKVANNIIELSYKENIEVLTILDDGFPGKLKIIKDRPVILFYKGNKECLNDDNSVAIIGTRNPSSHGEKIAYRLGNIFGSDGYVVVSGLAKGCDELAHKGCVDTNGKSVAVLPFGLDTIYPSSNKELAKRILEEGGCLVSEHQIGTKINRHGFVDRDRLQSALSSGIIVVEASSKSGTMHTVNYAYEQSKLVGCYKHKENFKEIDKISGNIDILNDDRSLVIDSRESLKIFKSKLIDISSLNSERNIEYKQQIKFDF